MVVPFFAEYEAIPEIGLYVARVFAHDEKGKPVFNASWYDAKLWTQERGLVLPTCRQWLKALDHFLLRAHDDIDYRTIFDLMSYFPIEAVDSLIAWPNQDGKYASNLDPRPDFGKYPLLVEGSFVEKYKDRYIVQGGTRIQLDNLLIGNRAQNDIPELGIRKDSPLYTGRIFVGKDEGEIREGMFAIGCGGLESEYPPEIHANITPSHSNIIHSFRTARNLGRVGLVPRLERASVEYEPDKVLLTV